MRLATLVIAILLLSCTSKKIHPVDAAYLDLLTQRIDSAGHNIDSVILECEQAMIDAGYFKNHEPQNYIAFIESIQVSGDIAAPKWLVGQNTSMLLNGLDVSYNSIDTSELAKLNLEDTSSFTNKAVRIFGDISSAGDISPKIISESVLRNINTKDFNSPLYKILFYKFLVRTMDVDKGLRVQLPDYPDIETEDVALDPNLVLEIMVDNDDKILVAGESVDLSELTELTKKFLHDTSIDNYGNTPDLSQKIISLKNQRGVSVKRYVSVYNELIRAYNEVRDELSLEEFGTSFKALESEQQKVIQKQVPLRISETEPVAY